MKQAIKICFVLSLLHAALFSLPATVSAAPTLQYSWNMDADPGWTTEGMWAFGQPTGGGGGSTVPPTPDPTSGYTGSNVYGYNLLGNYPNFLPETHLTSTPINCTGLSQVTLRFQRWLGVEEGYYDHAYIRVSNDGSVWTTVWENPDYVEVTDRSWIPQALDISSIADHQPKVYLRWTMGATDFAEQYCGWNIDDVEIWAESTVTPPTTITGSAAAISQTSATLNGTVNPNGASTTVAFNYGLTTSYGSTAAASQSPLTGTVSQAVSAGISGLAKKTTYHYRAVATSSAGTAYGADRTFTTVVSCPECSGPVVTLENVTFPSGKVCECTAASSITIGAGVTIETGATVTFQAPTVKLKPGFHAENGAIVSTLFPGFLSQKTRKYLGTRTQNPKPKTQNCGYAALE